MAFTIGRSLRAPLVASESRGNFEFAVSNYKLGSRLSLWATSQVSNDIGVEVSFEVMFRTLHDARLSPGSRELFIQGFKWLTGFAMVI